MLNAIDKAVEASHETVSSLVGRVCGYIPPLWDLSNYVAVNPFLGFTDRSVVDAARTVAHGLGAKTLPPVSYYRERWESGAFNEDALRNAASRLNLDPLVLQEILSGEKSTPYREESGVRSIAEQIDNEAGTDWNGALVRSMTRWCAVYASGETSSWRLPAHGLFASWREAETVDRSLEITGLKGWRKWMRQVPTTAKSATEQMLDRLKLPDSECEAYLYRLLGDVFGWACFFKRSSWQAGNGDGGLVAELLAIRICGDAAVAALVQGGTSSIATPRTVRIEDEVTRYAFQEALEDSYAAGLMTLIRPPVLTPEASPPPKVQAVFCIDVRSELLRRHLEAQSEAIETKGFAGFFGVSLEWQNDGVQTARCPVLLKPSVRLAGAGDSTTTGLKDALKYLQSAPASSFSFVELLGTAYGLGLGRDALAVASEGQNGDSTAAFDVTSKSNGQGIDLDARVDLAGGILTNMGLRTRFARLVLLCGHEGHSTNNPHAAGLDCGACGGHGGTINARVAAALLNDPEVRIRLRHRGIDVPPETLFLAGVHDTSVDQVMVHDQSRIPQSHAEDVHRLQEWLVEAGKATYTERAKDLGLNGSTPRRLSGGFAKRARDWSEVRPEWGLARNAAFIAARRERTRGVNLAGRTFLHDYDCSSDADNAILTLILTAPMVVASWINLQYFGSTVDNDIFGCGDKALHNRVGTLGVVLGNGGDLRTGLAKQSVHAADGGWFHEPLRLQVFVEAETNQIDQVLSAQKGVRDLLDNGWVRIFALHPRTNDVQHRVPAAGWKVFRSSNPSP